MDGSPKKLAQFLGHIDVGDAPHVIYLAFLSTFQEVPVAEPRDLLGVILERLEALKMVPGLTYDPERCHSCADIFVFALAYLTDTGRRVDTPDTVREILTYVRDIQCTITSQEGRVCERDTATAQEAVVKVLDAIRALLNESERAAQG